MRLVERDLLHQGEGVNPFVGRQRTGGTRSPGTRRPSPNEWWRRNDDTRTPSGERQVRAGAGSYSSGSGLPSCGDSTSTISPRIEQFVLLRLGDVELVERRHQILDEASKRLGIRPICTVSNRV